MPSLDLAEMWRRVRNPRKRTATLRPISPPGTMATNLFVAGYRDVVRLWEDALPDIFAEYERSLAELQTDAPADVAARISRVESEGAAIFITLRARLERWARILEEWHRRKWRSNVLVATGVDLQTMIGPADARLSVEAAIERNVALVRSVSDQTRLRISDAVFRGYTARKPAEEVGRGIRDAVGMARKRARNIAADQTVKLASSLNDERRRQVGIDTWAWVHSGKLHPRDWHLARDGKLYSENAARVGEEYQGQRIEAEPAADDRPGIPPFCGCTTRAVLIL